MNNCPICSHLILRHVDRDRIYWYCPHCHQEVPLLQKQHQVTVLNKSLTYLIPS